MLFLKSSLFFRLCLNEAAPKYFYSYLLNATTPFTFFTKGCIYFNQNSCNIIAYPHKTIFSDHGPLLSYCNQISQLYLCPYARYIPPRLNLPRFKRISYLVVGYGRAVKVSETNNLNNYFFGYNMQFISGKHLKQ